MPIYEFYCDDCAILFNFFSSRINTSKIPDCPKCKKALTRQISTFSTLGRAREPAEGGMPDFNEGDLDRVMGELAGDMDKINEDDPRQMAMMMRKFTEKSGLALGDGMEEALARMEAGEDPDKIEQEMGDLLEGEDPLAILGRKGGKRAVKKRLIRDETLYEL